MRKLAAMAVATATLAVVGLNTGVATASGGVRSSPRYQLTEEGMPT